jgi:hypothetical protein
MKYSFHPIAKEELLEAIEYYELYQAGLGFEFAKEIFATIQRILRFPKAWTKLSENTRRCLIYRFPYGIIYHVTNEEIFIIAIMQLNREPGYWKKRKK